MVACVFQGFIDITIKTLITGYVGRKPNWVFNAGSLWPQFSGTELFNDGTHNGVNGAWCDVFFKKGGNAGGGAGVSLNQWGDLTPFTSYANFMPGYYDGQITGIGSFAQNGAFPTFISGYQYKIDLNSNSNYPATGGIMPPQINPIQLTNIPTGFSFPVIKIGGIVTMLDKKTMVDFYSGTGFPQPLNMIDNFGNLYGFGNVYTGQQKIGGIAQRFYTPFNATGGVLTTGGLDQLATLFDGSGQPLITVFGIVWDNVTIDTFMHGSGNFISSTITPFGFLTYGFIATPFIVAGRTLNLQPLILTSFDGTKYWVINLVPGDAAAVTVVASAGAARAGHITPDGTFWFQNSVAQPSMIFSGVFPLPGITYLNGITIDLPYVPRLEQPLI
jgi:hypothetical protein